MRPPTGSRRLLASVLILGAAAICFQVVLIRESVCFCYGNEMALGLILAGWLAWTGLGSLAASTLLFRRPGLLAPALALGVILAPATFVLARLLGPIAGTVPGEVIGPGRALTLLFPLPAAFCLINGAVFALACSRACREGVPRGRVYAAEVLGAALGGVAAFVLPTFLAPAALVGLIGTGYLSAAALAAVRPRRWSAVAAVLVFLLAVSAGGRADAFLSSQRWRGYSFLAREGSPYAELTLLSRGGEISLFGNGMLWHTWPDLLGDQEAVWPVLLAHGSPRRVVLLGGEPSKLREIVRFPSVEEVIWVEIDPAAISLMKRYAGPLPPGVRVVAADPRNWLESSPGDWDAIISAAPDPLNSQVNRLYTLEFFRLVAARLAPGGVFTCSTVGSPNYLGEELRSYLGVILRTLRVAFPRVTFLGGEKTRFLASPDPQWMGLRRDLLEERCRSLPELPEYLAGGYLDDRLDPGREKVLRKQLAAESSGELNLDRKPLCYYYDTVFWSSYFRGAAAEWWPSFLKSSQSLRWWWFLLFLPAAAGLGFRRGGLGWIVLVTGFNGILLQVVLLIAFQVRHGSLYGGLGLLAASWMLGAGLGAVLAELRDSERALVPVLVGAALAALVLATWISAGEPGGEGLFFLAAGLLGAFSGAVFSLVVRLVPGTGSAGGFVYGLDLFGAALGGIAAGMFLVPVLGLTGSCLAAWALSLSALAAGLAGRSG